jgi:hypothetical protein
MLAKMTVTLPANFAGDLLKKEKAASVEALTQAAFHLRNTMKKEIKDSIKNPIPRTENAQLFRVDKKELTVDFFLNDNASKRGVSPAKYLSPLIHGTARVSKAMEGYFGGKYFLIPSPKTQLDQYGNIPGKQVTRMLSDLKAFGEVGSTMNAKGGKRGKKKQKKKDGYFIIPQSQRNPKVGVVMYRQGSEAAPFAVVTPTRPKYEKALDWYYVVEKNWPRYIDEEIAKAWDKYFGV